MAVLIAWAALFALGVAAAVTAWATVGVVRLRRTCDELADANIVLTVENIGLETEVDRCHRDLDDRNQKIRELTLEVQDLRRAAESGKRGGWSEF